MSSNYEYKNENVSLGLAKRDLGWSLTSSPAPSKVSDNYVYVTSPDGRDLLNVFELVFKQIMGESAVQSKTWSNTFVHYLSDYFEYQGTAEVYYRTYLGGVVYRQQRMALPLKQSKASFTIGSIDQSKFQMENTGNQKKGTSLMIVFKVKPKEDFWGGTGVPISKEGKKSNFGPSDTLNWPSVNVPLNISITMSQIRTYIGTSLSPSQLRTAAVLSPKPSRSYNNGAFVTVDLVYKMTDEEGLSYNYYYNSQTKVDKMTNLSGAQEIVLSERAFSLDYRLSATDASAKLLNAGYTKRGHFDGKLIVFYPIIEFKDLAFIEGESRKEISNGAIKAWYRSSTIIDNPPALPLDLEVTFDYDGRPITEDLLVYTRQIKLGGEELPVGSYRFEHLGLDEENRDYGEAAFQICLSGYSIILAKNSKGETDTFIYEITKLDDEAFKIQICVASNETIEVSNLSSGIYRVHRLGDWSWRYNGVADYIVNLGSGERVITLKDNTEPTKNDLFSTDFLYRLKK
jgi:hypothetical protein